MQIDIIYTKANIQRMYTHDLTADGDRLGLLVGVLLGLMVGAIDGDEEGLLEGEVLGDCRKPRQQGNRK